MATAKGKYRGLLVWMVCRTVICWPSKRQTATVASAAPVAKRGEDDEALTVATQLTGAVWCSTVWTHEAAAAAAAVLPSSLHSLTHLSSPALRR